MLDYITLLISLIISSVSAFYSVTGLTAIFAAAKWPIIIMGGALEVGKVVTTVWIRKNWHLIGRVLRLYLVVSIVILMLITSMGIFGFLSKAHLDQAVPSGDIQAQVQLLDERIQTERDNIAANRTVLTQMDNSVNEVLSRSKDQNGAERAVQIRRSQSSERNRLQKENETAQKRIQQLQTERAPVAAQVRKVEAEVGPIKYIAALIYGDNPTADFLERSVRWVIIILVAVFDPLALALMLAVNGKLELKQELDQVESSEKKTLHNPLTLSEEATEQKNPHTNINQKIKNQLNKISSSSQIQKLKKILHWL
jgi:hypothetical protein